MRRKAEVLKHSGPQKSTQGNKLTKAQRFAQVVSGSSPTQKLYGRNNKEYAPGFCDSSLNLIPTSSSDVPGPIISLYLDNMVPLYMYASPDNALSSTVYENTDGFSYLPNPNTITFYSNVAQTIGILEIYTQIPNGISTFTLTIPYTSASNTIINVVALIVTYGGTSLNSSAYRYEITQSSVTITNISLFTMSGYIFLFALQFTDSNISSDLGGSVLTLAI